VKHDLRRRIEPVLVQETQELLGMLSDAVTVLAAKASRGDDDAQSVLRQIRDEIHTLTADARDASAEGKG
jgi:hypothetical protein